jgi:hypothetical protein
MQLKTHLVKLSLDNEKKVTFCSWMISRAIGIFTMPWLEVKNFPTCWKELEIEKRLNTSLILKALYKVQLCYHFRQINIHWLIVSWLPFNKEFNLTGNICNRKAFKSSRRRTISKMTVVGSNMAHAHETNWAWFNCCQISLTICVSSTSTPGGRLQV